MKSILVICPTRYDYQELSFDRITSKYKIFFQIYDDNELYRVLSGCKTELTSLLNPQKFIDYMVSLCKEKKIDGVVSVDDYPGSILASIIATKAGLPAPSPESVLLCQHKFHCRQAQYEIVPDATPDFTLINPRGTGVKRVKSLFPLFVKPIKSRTSIFANHIDSPDHLKTFLKKTPLPKVFTDSFNWFLKTYSSLDIDGGYWVGEEVLQGIQTTLEGYVRKGGVQILGIVDSVMFPDTMCFERFDYPSRVPLEAQKRMEHIAKKLMNKLGFDNGFFNMEFMYNPASHELYIIEVNPRMCSQFPDLYEKVDGTNSYDYLLKLATGKVPKVLKENGKHKVASIFVLRQFENARVMRTPSLDEVEKFYKKFSDGRFHSFVKQGQLLSDEPQDGKSYAYGLIHLGGKDHKDLQAKFKASKKLLPFEFATVI